MSEPVPSRLSRRLGLGDAILIGLGSMIGAGVFSAIGPAANVAGNALLIGLVLAAVVAYCNATSSAALAALYPESGGTYVYGRKRLGVYWGFLAGWCFVVGKLASCAAMAMTFGSYVSPEHAHPLAVVAVFALTAVNLLGVQKTALATRVIVVLVLLALAVVVFALLAGGEPHPDRLFHIEGDGPAPYGVLQSAGLLFFAFAGYARIATLGEEVVDPAKTIPRAVPIALAITLVIYAAVAVSALMVVDAHVLAASAAPLAAAVEQGRYAALSPVVRAGAAIASAGVLLSLIAGVSRTMFAMASNGDLPRALAAVHARYRVPHRAEITAGLVVAAAAAFADLRSAIGFSSFAVLLYYAIANASAFTLNREERRWPRPLAAIGVAGCVVIAACLPLHAVAGGAALLAAGSLIWLVRSRRSDA